MGGCVAVCSETSESVVAAGHHFSAIQALNRRCGCKHRKAYNIWEEVRVAQNSHKMKVHDLKVTERRTVTQLNERVYGR